jgi:Carboxypeptidase regulatory-like domain
MKKSLIISLGLMLLAAIGVEAATITGTVKSGSGAGIAVEGAKVLLRSTRGNGAVQDSTITNAKGEFSFVNATTGYKIVQASKTGFQNSQVIVDVVLATGTYAAALTLIAVAPPPLPGSVTGIVRAGTPTGALITGAQIIISRVNGDNGQIPIDTVLTNAQGIYTFPSIPVANNYTVRATATGYNPAIDNNVDVVTNTTTIANLVMILAPPPPPPGSVTGTVRSTSATGTPIAGARIIISKAGGGIGSALDTVLTNAMGVYIISPVPVANNYLVTVSVVGFDPAANNNVDVITATATTVNFILVANPNAGKPGSIAGTIRKSDSTAVAIGGALVMLSRNGVKIDSAITLTDGRYSFASVEALQNYTVTVSATGFNTAINTNVNVMANTTSTTDFRLDIAGFSRTLGRITGQVTTDGAKGIASAMVIIYRTQGGGTRDTTTTDATGHYGIDSIVPGTAYTVAAIASNYQIAMNNNVNVVAGQAVLADFILVASTGLVHGSSGSKFGLRFSEVHGIRTVGFAGSPVVSRLSGFDIRGGRIFSDLIPATSKSFALPKYMGIQLLVLERAGEVESLFVPMARE